MDELRDLAALAVAMGVQTRFADGLGRHVQAQPETLVRVCAALGAGIRGPADAREALMAYQDDLAQRILPPVAVAWAGRATAVPVAAGGAVRATLRFEHGGEVHPPVQDGGVQLPGPLPMGYHQLTVEASGRQDDCTVIAAPLRAWRRAGSRRSWGLGTHLAALRSARSRSLGDLTDLEVLSTWVGERGGDLVTVLPLLPTFNEAPAEPSPYSPVSRLFWSELMLDLGDAHRGVAPPGRLDVTRADMEVRRALDDVPAPDRSGLDGELTRYARFRGAQARLGRDWRRWPQGPRSGVLDGTDVDPDEERFHLVAQTMARSQLLESRSRMAEQGVRLGLDLAVGVHPDGYDPWSRQDLFAEGMSVGAPPDEGFPSGQDWGFSPLLPGAMRLEGHRYLAASVAHQAAAAGVLRVDHIMAMSRLYWIPHGADIHEGTYVTYPMDELFAILMLESHRHGCEILGENLGTVPAEIRDALPRHGVRGMYLAEFQAASVDAVPPGASDVAFIGTHDTPTLAGWMNGTDIEERVRTGLLESSAGPAQRERRDREVGAMAKMLHADGDDPVVLLAALLDWLGTSQSPLVIPWIEDLWLEKRMVNLPGTRSTDRPNWQRPMARLLDEVLTDDEVGVLVRRLERARRGRADRPAVPPLTPPGEA